MKIKNKPKFGKLHTHSEGKVHPSDEGDIQFGVGADLAHGVVILQFGTPVRWLGLPPDQARKLAAILIENADKIGAKPQ